MRTRLLNVSALLATLSSVASSSAVAQQLPTGQPTQVQAYGDVVVFSQRDARGGRFRLTRLLDGRAEALPIASRAVPFDVDLGPDRRGRVVAVYSRCREEPAEGTVGTTLPPYRTGSGCRLFRYDFRGRRESRIGGLAGRSSSFLPTIWRDRLAWAETDTHAVEDRDPAPRLMLRDGDRRIRRVRAGSTPAVRAGDLTAPGPVSLDLRGRRLALTWTYVSRKPSCRPGAPIVGPTPATESWLITLGQGRRLLLHGGCREDRGSVQWTALGEGEVLIVHRREDAGAPAVDLVRRVAFGTGVSADAPLETSSPAEHVLAVAPLPGGRIAYTQTGSQASLTLTTPSYGPIGP